MPYDQYQNYIMMRRRQARYSRDVDRYYQAKQSEYLAQVAAAQRANEERARLEAEQNQQSFDLSPEQQARISELQSMSQGSVTRFERGARTEIPAGETYQGIKAGLAAQQLEASFRLEKLQGAPEDALFFTSEGEKITRDTATRRLQEQRDALTKQMDDITGYQKQGYQIRKDARGDLEFFKTEEQVEREVVGAKMRDIAKTYDESKGLGAAHFVTTGFLSWEDPLSLKSMAQLAVGDKRGALETKARASMDLDAAIKEGAHVYAVKAAFGPGATVFSAFAVGNVARVGFEKGVQLTTKAALTYGAITGAKAAAARAAPLLFKGGVALGGAALGGFAVKDVYETYKRDPLLAGVKGAVFLGTLYAGYKGWKSVEAVPGFKPGAARARDSFYKAHPDKIQLVPLQKGVPVGQKTPGRFQQLSDTIKGKFQKQPQKPGKVEVDLSIKQPIGHKIDRPFTMKYGPLEGDVRSPLVARPGLKGRAAGFVDRMTTGFKELVGSRRVGKVAAVSAREKYMKSSKFLTDPEGTPFVAPESRVWSPHPVKARVGYARDLMSYYSGKVLNKVNPARFGKSPGTKTVDAMDIATGGGQPKQKGLIWGKTKVKVDAVGDDFLKVDALKIGARGYKPAGKTFYGTPKPGASMTVVESAAVDFKGVQLSGEGGQLKTKPLFDFFKTRVVKGRTGIIKTKWGGRRIYDYGIVNIKKYSVLKGVKDGSPDMPPSGAVPKDNLTLTEFFKGKTFDSSLKKWVSSSPASGDVSITGGAPGKPGAASLLQQVEPAVSKSLGVSEATDQVFFNMDYVAPRYLDAAMAGFAVKPGLQRARSAGAVGGVLSITPVSTYLKPDVVAFEDVKDMKTIKERSGMGKRFEYLGRQELTTEVKAVPEVARIGSIGDIDISLVGGDFKEPGFQSETEGLAYSMSGQGRLLIQGPGLKPDFDRMTKARQRYADDIIFEVDVGQRKTSQLRQDQLTVQQYKFARMYGLDEGTVSIEDFEFPGAPVFPMEVTFGGGSRGDTEDIFVFGRKRKHPIQDINISADEIFGGGKRGKKTRKR